MQPSSAGKSKGFARQLREAAKREVRVQGAKPQRSPKVEFDSDHDSTPTVRFSVDDFDSHNGVAQYPGPNVEHVGNGSGGPRR